MPINRLSPIINGQLTSDEIFVGAQLYIICSIRINMYCLYKLWTVCMYHNIIYTCILTIQFLSLQKRGTVGNEPKVRMYILTCHVMNCYH